MTPMPLRAGQPAPEFDVRSDDGRRVRLADLRGQWVVLYFYPRANTPGCSTEARRFEAALPEFGRLNAAVIGISTDTEARQANFRDNCGLSFPLIPDSERTLSRAYGVIGGLGGLLGLAARQTFLIDPEGNLAHHWRTVNPATHAADVLRWLQQHI
ncbi:peroxiredoxin Bcp [Deinococcus aluminii]|uniref:thioredoxin-dependent peroxiredoxin n=2 Tax=Deinococcus aluminii TaxID=1656885 RepID=A0ABP9X8G5_9DEIO